MGDVVSWSDLDRPPLNARQLSTAVRRDDGVWREVRVLPEVASTNTYVADLARRGEPAGLVVVAENQPGGRGRLDRTWVSPPRAGLTFSMLLRPGEVPPARWGWLPLLTGVALAEAIGRIADVDAWVKWPNDLLLGEGRRKAAGILAEVVGDAVVVGVGLNVTTRAEELPHDQATSLGVEGAVETDRAPLLRAVLRETSRLYTEWTGVGGDPGRGLLEAYRRVCDTLGRPVRVSLPGGDVLDGEARDVDAEGRLLVTTASGEVAVGAGDVVHVRPHPDAAT